MNILEKIIAYKKPLVTEKKVKEPVAALRESAYFNRKPFSLKQALADMDSSGIIAEFKRKSPSKPAINLGASVKEVTKGYQEGGAAALSILTDEHFFGGKIQDIMQVREQINIPILRKDFIFDPYQVYEAKSIGADAILLIAEVLSKEKILELSSLAWQLRLEVLMEIHSTEQLSKISPFIDIIGVNNRNLKTFETSIQNSIELAPEIPNDVLRISESGIHSVQEIQSLQSVGYKGFLIGEQFMKTQDPANTCRNFIQEIKGLKSMQFSKKHP